MKNQEIANYGIYGTKGQSSYFQGKFQGYGKYQWNVKSYEFNNEFEIESARDAFFETLGTQQIWLEELNIRGISQVFFAGRSGGWLVINDDLTEEEVSKITKYIKDSLKALPEFLKQEREFRAQEELEFKLEKNKDNNIQVTKKLVCGRVLIYPINDKAKIFSELTNSKTLSDKTLTKIGQLGIEIEWVDENN